MLCVILGPSFGGGGGAPVSFTGVAVAETPLGPADVPKPVPFT